MKDLDNSTSGIPKEELMLEGCSRSSLRPFTWLAKTLCDELFKTLDDHDELEKACTSLVLKYKYSLSQFFSDLSH